MRRGWRAECALSFVGFENLKQIRGEFQINQNPLLDSIDALSDLHEIRGGINIAQNPKLTPCEISKTLDGAAKQSVPVLSGSPACSP